MQAGFFDWLTGNIAAAMALFSAVLIVLMVIYLKIYAKIVPPGTYYRFYRKGVLIREGSGGTMVIRIPFIDRLELLDSESDSF